MGKCKRIDIGDKFGKLTVLEELNKKNKETRTNIFMSMRLRKHIRSSKEFTCNRKHAKLRMPKKRFCKKERRANAKAE